MQPRARFRDLLLFVLLPFPRLDRLTFEVHGHVAKEGDESFTFESISPALHLRLSRADAPWKIGVFAEYEISQVDEHEDRAETRLSASRNFARRGENLTTCES